MKHESVLLIMLIISTSAGCKAGPAPEPPARATPQVLATAKQAPTPTATPTREPQPTPTATEEPPAAGSPAVCPSSWTTWKARHPITGAEIYDAPVEVKECVRAQYLESFRAVAPRALTEFDPARLNRLLGNPPGAPPPAEVRTVQYTKRVVVVTSFAADGLHCKVGDYTEGGTIQTYTWPEGELMAEKSLPDQVIVYAMEYDGDSSRWEVAQPPGQASTPLAVQELPWGIPDIVVELYGLVED